MKMGALVIGVGAAGNKAVITAVEEGVILLEDILLINSTLDDVPAKYKDVAIHVKGTIGGCGKEGALGKKIILEAIQNKSIDLDSSIDPSRHKMVVIAGSVGGGSGNGMVPVIAAYYRTKININTHVIAFKGFGQDSREFRNTISFFKNMKSNFVIQCIENSKFLKDANGDTFKAEKLANLEFCSRLRTITGTIIEEAEQNIDAMDIYKVVNTPGFTDSGYYEFDERLKNREQFNTIIKSMIDDSKGMDIDTPSQLRLGVIINIPESEKGAIDYMMTVLKDHYGKCDELFTHIQYNESKPRFIAYISSGMLIPMKELERVHEKYVQESSQINKGKDSFFSDINDLEINEEDSVFDVGSDTPELNSGSMDDFLSLMGNDTPNNQGKEAESEKGEFSEF